MGMSAPVYRLSASFFSSKVKQGLDPLIEMLQMNFAALHTTS